jgi:endoglucanase
MTDPARRSALGSLALLCSAPWLVPGPTRAAPAPGATCSAAVSTWPGWLAFKQALLTREGRIADPRDGRFHTVSEAQAYALFFALVANDRPAFDALLAWTERELCAGDPATTLPAWHWGRDEAGHWHVLDRNAASDADLWLAYTLAQAGRMWQEPLLLDKAGRLASLIADREVVPTGPSRSQLLPGPVGFSDTSGQLRLNPSYLPLPLLRWFTAYAAGPVWPGLLQGSLQLLHASAPHGLAPDWHLMSMRPATSAPPPAGSAPLRLSREQRLGGFDAIRVYLWLGLTAPQEPERARLLARHAPMCELVERLGQPPLSVDPARRAADQRPSPGPRGFAAALLPFAQAQGRSRCEAVLRDRLRHEPADARVYYDAALDLFAQGHLDARYRFGVDGSLWTAWAACAAPAHAHS